MNPDQEVLLERLRDVGLSRYEASVYLGLVTDQGAKVTEISKRTGVPQPKVYQALDALVEKGFCALGSDLVNRYRPIPPALAVRQHLDQLDRRRKDALALADELEDLLARGEGQALWAPPVEIVKGLGQVINFLVESVQDARSSIGYFGKLPQVPAPELSQAIQARAEEGVRVRMVFERGYLESCDVPALENATFAALRGERRLADSLPSKMILIDGTSALISISRPDAESFLLIVLRHDGLASHFAASFERAWEAAEPM